MRELNTAELKRITEAVAALCQRADQEVIQPLQQKAKGLRIDSKDNTGRNFVTEADVGTENFLKEHLSQLFPEAGFIAEESHITTDQPLDSNAWNWIIDPIDGTTNFMHNMPPYCISVGLTQGYEVKAGVIFELFSKECFTAWKGGGAWRNGERIQVSQTPTIKESLLVTGFPYVHGEALDEWIRIFGKLTHESRGVRRLGAAAVDMAYVACGRFDAFFEYNLEPWDVAAGSIICTEAGATISDFSGGENYLFGKQLIVGNPSLYPAIKSALKGFSPGNS